MNLKKYETKTLIFSVTICLFIIVLLFMVRCQKRQIKTYIKLDGNIISSNLVSVMVTSSELKMIYKNKYLLIDQNKKLIKIRKIEKNILKREKTYYHQVFLDVSLNSKLKEGDFIDILLFDKKINVFSMIKIIWKGE